MPKVLFIAGVEHISISTNLGHGDKIGNLLITSDEATIRPLITSQFRSIAGSLEVSYLLRAGAVIYLIDDCDPFSTDEAGIEYLLRHLAALRIFLQMLWLVKDNAVNVELGYIEYPYKQSQLTSTVSRNSYSNLYSDARGRFETVEFSREELRKARHLFRDYVGNVISRSQSVGKMSRFARALYFLQAARASADLGVRITNYCTAFEALFSTDTQELSHKLSERIACFLESEAAMRKDLFREMKKSYSIRSTVVHGGSASAKLQSSVVEAAQSCDRTLRRVLNKILENETLQTRFMVASKEKEEEDYFLSLVLGSSE